MAEGLKTSSQPTSEPESDTEFNPNVDSTPKDQRDNKRKARLDETASPNLTEKQKLKLDHSPVVEQTISPVTDSLKKLIQQGPVTNSPFTNLNMEGDNELHNRPEAGFKPYRDYQDPQFKLKYDETRRSASTAPASRSPSRNSPSGSTRPR